MKRAALLTALLVAVLACAAALSKPAPLHAIMCCDNGGYTTQQYYWVKAATCAAAQTAFRALAKPEANDFCGGSTLVCAITIPPCQDWSSQDPANPWYVSGVMTFGCKETCGPPLP